MTEHAAVSEEVRKLAAIDHFPRVFHEATGYLVRCECGWKSKPCKEDEDLHHKAWAEHFDQLLSDALRAADLAGYRRAFSEAPDSADIQEAVVKKLGAVSKDALQDALRTERERVLEEAEQSVQQAIDVWKTWNSDDGYEAINTALGIKERIRALKDAAEQGGAR